MSLVGEEALALLVRIAESLERIEGRLPGLVPRQPGRQPEPRGPGAAYISARSFVYAELSADGPASWESILQRGLELGHGKSTLEKARHEVAEYRVENGRYIWRLREGVNQRG